ncbi:TPA: hypothetical protein ACQ0F8_002043 [Streptococcus agalactiae]|nr:hypothetical protein [Streptococcus agalactiae]
MTTCLKKIPKTVTVALDDNVILSSEVYETTEGLFALVKEAVLSLRQSIHSKRIEGTTPGIYLLRVLIAFKESLNSSAEGIFIYQGSTSKVINNFPKITIAYGETGLNYNPDYDFNQFEFVMSEYQKYCKDCKESGNLPIPFDDFEVYDYSFITKVFKNFLATQVGCPFIYLHDNEMTQYVDVRDNCSIDELIQSLNGNNDPRGSFHFYMNRVVAKVNVDVEYYDFSVSAKEIIHSKLFKTLQKLAVYEIQKQNYTFEDLLGRYRTPSNLVADWTLKEINHFFEDCFSSKQKAIDIAAINLDNLSLTERDLSYYMVCEAFDLVTKHMEVIEENYTKDIYDNIQVVSFKIA